MSRKAARQNILESWRSDALSLDRVSRKLNDCTKQGSNQAATDFDIILQSFWLVYDKVHHNHEVTNHSELRSSLREAFNSFRPYSTSQCDPRLLTIPSKKWFINKLTSLFKYSYQFWELAATYGTGKEAVTKRTASCTNRRIGQRDNNCMGRLWLENV